MLCISLQHAGSLPKSRQAEPPTTRERVRNLESGLDRVIRQLEHDVLPSSHRETQRGEITRVFILILVAIALPKPNDTKSGA